jgi:hypothetical protein
LSDPDGQRLFDTAIPEPPGAGLRSGPGIGRSLTLKLIAAAAAVLLCGLSVSVPATVPGDNGARPDRKIPQARDGDGGRPAARPSEWSARDKRALEALVVRTSKRYGVERALVSAIIAAESAFDPHAVSHAGAIGLMQVMPATAAEYGVTDARHLFDPAVNVRTGVRHLKRLLDKYNNDYGRAIMAYNAGEGVVDRTNSNVTYLETLNYTEAVIRNYRRNGGNAPTQGALIKVAFLRRLTNPDRARHLLRQYLKLSLPAVKTLSTLSLGDVDPGLRDVLPDSKPMVVQGPQER